MHLNLGLLTRCGTGLALAIVALAAGGCGGKVNAGSDESEKAAGRSSLASVYGTPPPDDASAPDPLPISPAVDAGGLSAPAEAGLCDSSKIAW